MKYIVILTDGMSDYPVSQLDGKTPLQFAHKPNMDFMAQNGKMGMVKTIPEGLPPGSDAANLSVMGYNPEHFYTGRSPLEAVSMGIELSETDVALRCNLVTLSDVVEYDASTMLDHSADEISTAESTQLIKVINNFLSDENIHFYPGVSYRHCMVWKNGPLELNLTPPHDILERNISDYLPKGLHGEIIYKMMRMSREVLNSHPINRERVKKGLKPANSIWLWGEGKKPALPYFSDKYKVKGSVISAVDLIKGIGICAGLKPVNVEGATGNIHTNFRGKAEAAIKELEDGMDFVYIHVEAPDECGHRFEIENKVKSIELIDQLVVKVLIDRLEKFHDYKILLLPDHSTPLSLRTHTSDPVPFIVYQKSKSNPSGYIGYDEVQASKSPLFIDKGHTLMDIFIGGND